MTDVLALLPPGAPLILRDGDRVVLAEQALEGLMRAEAYRRTDPCPCRLPLADIVGDDGQRIDQLLFGEAFDVLERREARQGKMRAWGRARRDGQVLSLCMADVDYFKSYNDTQGHLGGDECLRAVARVLEQCAGLPIVFATGEAKAPKLAAGRSFYLPKPYGLNDLKTVLGRVTGED